MKKILIILLSTAAFIFFILFSYFFIGSAPRAAEITWGVNFSQKQSGNLGLDWKAVYSALLDDLGVKQLKIITHWDLIEKEWGKYDFNDLDWQMNEAGKRGAKVLLVIGMKTGRWPECHIPPWVEIKNPKPNIQNSLFVYLEEIIKRYKDSKIIRAWQVENEAFFPFGECPPPDKGFLKKEIELVKSLDPARPVMVSDSGEFSFWIQAARLGDVVGATLHRRVWFKEISAYITYPLRPVFYWRKAQIVKTLFNKEVMVGELQAEPWCPTSSLKDCPLAEQQKTMDLKTFKDNIEFAKNTGLNRHYLWGAEWWYWMKEKQGRPEIWGEAGKLF